jgi:uncharacterized membrane protein HdeD (DUF308 family)
MIVVFVGDWRSHALRGAAALLFGLGTLLWPGITVTAFVLLFGAFAFVDGLSILGVVLAGDRWPGRRQALLIVQGVASIAAGIIAVVWTGMTALALLYVIAAWAIVIGTLEIVAAVRLRRVTTDEWMVALSGVLTAVFGALLFIFPGTGALAITWLIGWFAAVSGAVHIAFAWRLRKLEGQLDRAVGAVPTPSGRTSGVRRTRRSAGVLQHQGDQGHP